MKKATVIFALMLAGCASPGGEGTASTSNGMRTTDAARLSQTQWLVTCTAVPSDCTQRATKLCPSGFDVADMTSNKSASGAAGPYGGGFGVYNTYQMKVTCKAS